MLRKLMLLRRKKLVEEQLAEKRSFSEELEKRRKELAIAIEEVKTDEEREAVEEEIKIYEEDKAKHEGDVKNLETVLGEIEGELESLDKNPLDVGEPDNEPNQSDERTTKKVREERGTNMPTRSRYFGGATREQLRGHLERDEVRDFVGKIKNKELRALKNGELGIPEVTLDIIRDNLNKYSKLIDLVNLKKIPGNGRQIIPGAIPEAVWTEACAKINELDIEFNLVEVNAYKVAGYMPMCNSTLDDSTDIDLYNEILYALAQAIGLAIDKAIVYGTGKKMPEGIVTRLAQKTQPENYDPKARKWVDLSTTNILKMEEKTGVEFFADFVEKTGVAKANYSNGVKIWIMNDKTKTKLISKALTFDAAGAAVSSLNDTMPVVGGKIETLDFVPDGDVIGGYASLYLLAERKGATVSASEHAQFIEDNTLFKGVARYDGKPIIAEGFVALNISNKEFTTTITFAEDKANSGV